MGMAFFVIGGANMADSVLAAISIVVEDPGSVEALNAILHNYAPCIIGRMGIPYRQRGVSFICVAADAPADRINGLCGKLGRLRGVTARAAYSSAGAKKKEERDKNEE